MTEVPFSPDGARGEPVRAGRPPAAEDAVRGTDGGGSGRTWAGRLFAEARAALLSARWAWAAMDHG